MLDSIIEQRSVWQTRQSVMKGCVPVSIALLGQGGETLLELVAFSNLDFQRFIDNGKFFGGILPAPEWFLQAATSLISFVVITGLFAMIYKLVPDVRLKWSDVIVGASVTALLFTAGKHLIGLYLGKASFGSTYGAAGSLVVVLVWVYYSSQLFFLGAEFTKVYTKKFGSQFKEKLELNTPKPVSAILNPADVASPPNERGQLIL